MKPAVNTDPGVVCREEWAWHLMLNGMIYGEKGAGFTGSPHSR